MKNLLAGVCLLLGASAGCHYCDSSCDYLPPVVTGEYFSGGPRIGSIQRTPHSAPNTASEPITPMAPEEQPLESYDPSESVDPQLLESGD